jgi:hypothetical protein
MVSAAFCNSGALIALYKNTLVQNFSKCSGEGEGLTGTQALVHIFRKILYRGSLKRRMDLFFVFYMFFLFFGST